MGGEPLAVVFVSGESVVSCGTPLTKFSPLPLRMNLDYCQNIVESLEEIKIFI